MPIDNEDLVLDATDPLAARTVRCGSSGATPSRPTGSTTTR